MWTQLYWWLGWKDSIIVFILDLILILMGCCFFAELTKHPVDGFSAGLIDDSNLFEWQITIMGPPDTL